MHVIVHQAGGLKGAFGAPILTALVEQRKPDYIFGASVGALNGVLVACGRSALLKEQYMAIDDINYLDGITGLFTPAFFNGKGLLSTAPIRKKIERFTSLNELSIPFGCGAVARENKEHVMFLSENMKSDTELYDAVQASISIAFLFEPVKFRHEGKMRTWSDAGHKHSIPRIPDDIVRKITEIDVILCNPIRPDEDEMTKVDGLAASLSWILDMDTVAIQAADMRTYMRYARGGIDVRVYAPPEGFGSTFQADKKSIRRRWKMGEDMIGHPINLKDFI